jgi:hypothetical protein
MKRLFAMLVVLSAVAFSVAVSAEEKAAKAAPAPATIKGELVDLGCYLGHEARGEKHKSCAMKCVANGMPMGILTADNKLYLLTVSHDSSDPFNKAKELVASTVELTGVISERAGMKSIAVSDVKPVTTASK